jgi:hypothetical protein
VSGVGVGLTGELAHKKACLVVRQPEALHLSFGCAYLCSGHGRSLFAFAFAITALVLLVKDEIVILII